MYQFIYWRKWPKETCVISKHQSPCFCFFQFHLFTTRAKYRAPNLIHYDNIITCLNPKKLKLKQSIKLQFSLIFSFHSIKFRISIVLYILLTAFFSQLILYNSAGFILGLDHRCITICSCMYQELTLSSARTH